MQAKLNLNRCQMAAIISQLTANKRARAKRIKNTVPIDKSVYVLPPFDPVFDPFVHNRYLKAVKSKEEQILQQQITLQIQQMHTVQRINETKVPNQDDL